MLRTILCAIPVIMISFNAHALAWCGAELSFELEEQNKFDNSYSTFSRDGEYGYNTTNSSRGPLGYTKGKVKFSVPFGDQSCEKDKATTAKLYAERRDREADAMDQRIRNFNNIVKLCKDNDIPNLCSRIPMMARELNID